MNLLNYLRPILIGATAITVGTSAGLAQAPNAPAAVPPPPAAAPAAPAVNPVCARLESQLASVDRGTSDPARAAQLKRYEDSIAKQQADLDRMSAQSQRQGCQGAGIFSLFISQPPQCNAINSQVQQMRTNLDRMTADYQRLQPNSGEQESQRQNVIAALAQNNCGPQYRAAAGQQRGLFDVVFGSTTGFGGDGGPSGTYRTVCVRMCDGYYYPISFATSPSRFRDDQDVCLRTCPATDVALYAYRNPGGEMREAISIDGKRYTDLPNAFRYRQEYNPSCACRKPGQSWADALSQGRDTTVERGDIVVTDDKAKALSQPKIDPRAAAQPQGGARPATPAPGNAPTASTSTQTAPAPGGAAGSPVDSRSIRTIGPTPYQVR